MKNLKIYKNVSFALSYLFFLPSVAEASYSFPCTCSGLMSCVTVACFDEGKGKIQKTVNAAKCTSREVRIEKAIQCFQQEAKHTNMPIGCKLDKILKDFPDCHLAHDVKNLLTIHIK